MTYLTKKYNKDLDFFLHEGGFGRWAKQTFSPIQLDLYTSYLIDYLRMSFLFIIYIKYFSCFLLINKYVTIIIYILQFLWTPYEAPQIRRLINNVEVSMIVHAKVPLMFCNCGMTCNRYDHETIWAMIKYSRWYTKPWWTPRHRWEGE